MTPIVLVAMLALSLETFLRIRVSIRRNRLLILGVSM